MLGSLLWWKVGEVNLTHDDLAAALEGTKIEPPTRPIPVDVFRKVVGITRDYLLNPETGAKLTGYTMLLRSNDKTIHHDIVGTLSDGKAVVSHEKLGEMVFYRPPRGQHSKARMRLIPRESAWPEAARFVEHLRSEYAKGVNGAVDGQAVRRTVRRYLADTGVIYLDGPYFFDANTADPSDDLRALFGVLGEDSYFHIAPMFDDQPQRDFLKRGVERLVTAGHSVPDPIWAILRR